MNFSSFQISKVVVLMSIVTQSSGVDISVVILDDIPQNFSVECRLRLSNSSLEKIHLDVEKHGGGDKYSFKVSRPASAYYCYMRWWKIKQDNNEGQKKKEIYLILWERMYSPTIGEYCRVLAGTDHRICEWHVTSTSAFLIQYPKMKYSWCNVTRVVEDPDAFACRIS